MQIFYLGLGSNIGDRYLNLMRACQLLAGYFSIISSSSIYETKPLCFEKQSYFLNQALKLESVLSIEKVFFIIKKIERLMGRQDTFLYGPRLIDIDLLLYSDSIYSSEKLSVPHSSMLERRFVLEPLLEIDKDIRLPHTKRSIKGLLKDLEKQDIYRLYKRELLPFKRKENRKEENKKEIES